MFAIINLENDSVFLNTRILKKQQYSNILEIEKLKELIHKNSQALIENSIQEYFKNKQLGYEQGLQDAQTSFMAEYAQIMQDREDEVNNLEKKMIEIISMITQKIAYSVVGEDYIKAAVFDALTTYRNEIIKFFISPVHKQSIQDIDNLIAEKFKNQQIKIEFDDTLSETACIIETKTGRVDLSLETKIENYKNVLKKAANATQ